jgi:hypothetical protein
MKKPDSRICLPSNVPRIDWSFLLTEAPPIIWRHKWAQYVASLGLPYSRGTMQNLDAAGNGPERVGHGRSIGYRREDLVRWLTARR